MDRGRSAAVHGGAGGRCSAGPPGPRGGETPTAIKASGRAPSAHPVGRSPSLPPYRLFPSAEKLPCSLRLLRLSSSPASAPSALGNWMASPKTPTQSTGAQEEAAARQSLIGISQSTPAAGEALSVKSPNGRMEHGQDDSGAADKSRSMLMSISNQSPEARQATPCPHSNAA
ncbi:uncharacterized protein [Aegilops tauschii subsp. strangulata]|uniref:Uncharacterized protein n=1 Tax=Triticum aestivum TaxID=4565 RepID=A0A3B6DIH9_WHEAT|nr:atrophin-1 [Aegilops tauschii subsp. strangulata]XP_044334242.1 atrophin-1-like [Triticum aestivum]